MKKLLPINILIYLVTFGILFYQGSVNANIWGKWEAFEIVAPLIISAIIAAIFITPVLIIEFIYYRKKK